MDKIYAVDEPGGTFYVLCRKGHFVASCAWPQPLEQAYPDAIRAGTLGSSAERFALPPGAERGSGVGLYADLLARIEELAV